MKLDLDLTKEEILEAGAAEVQSRVKICRTAYGPRIRAPFIPTGDPVTKQSEKDACDINKIIAKYHRTGMLPHVNNLVGRFLDVDYQVDYHDALNMVHDAHDMFSALPSDLRNRFHNDPELFVDFVSNPENIAELQTMGIIPETPPAEEPPPAGSSPEEPPPAE